MPSVSSVSAVASTSRIDFAPEATTSACVRASSARSAETSRRVGPAAVHAADPARAQEADPRGAHDGERPADGRRADGALHDAGREVARADLAGVRAEPAELVLGEADADLAVEHADRRGHRARLAHAALALEPDGDAFAGREPVRDERRLERDDRAVVVEASRTSGATRSLLQLHLDELDLPPALEPARMPPVSRKPRVRRP